ncbi:hypothetical protein VZT92_004327 [Zoarces viviparus]|uniref:Uncharacterized protein n=1 Tax=Zoarces viviparus TaxID=48416 RepID=A0AAW1FW80_ZOAVI
MADICTAHGHLRWFIYPRPPDQASDLPAFVRLEGAPYYTTQFLTFHISSHFQLPVSLYHSTRPDPVQANYSQFQRSGKRNRPASVTLTYGRLHLDEAVYMWVYQSTATERCGVVVKEALTAASVIVYVPSQQMD